MIVYIDSDYRCYTNPAAGRRAVETDFFDGKCPRFVEGYRVVPAGESWQRPDGERFTGPMVSPAEDSRLLTACQQFYEKLSAEFEEHRQKLQRLQDCVDGLSTIPSLEQLQDCLAAIREVLEDD